MRSNLTLPEAIAYLRLHHAKSSALEAAFAFNGASGALLDFAVGTEDAVDLDEAKFQHCVHVVVLHSHPVNAAALQDDWQYFLEQNNQREFVVVAPTSTYFLAKPPSWAPNYQWHRSPYEDWLDHLAILCIEWQLAEEDMLLPSNWQLLTIEVNVRMARQYGLNFSWQSEEVL